MVVISLSLAVLAVGGYYAYRMVNWHRLMPTGLLLSLQGDEKDPATTELLRRHQAGQLSIAHTKGMFAQAMEVVPLTVMTPFPARVESRISLMHRIRLPGTMPGYQWWMRRDAWAIAVDGHVVSSSAQTGPEAYQTSRLASPAGLSLTLPGLEPGTHEVRVEQTLTLTTQAGSAGRPPTPLHTWRIASAATTVIEDRPAREYVKLVLTPELTAQLEAVVQIPGNVDFSPLWRYTVPYRTSPALPVAIVGELQARPSGDGPFHRLEILENEKGSGRARYLKLDSVPGIEGASHVDIRIVPDAPGVAEKALWLGIRQYYGGLIERFNVPVTHQPPSDGESTGGEP